MSTKKYTATIILSTFLLLACCASITSARTIEDCFEEFCASRPVFLQLEQACKRRNYGDCFRLSHHPQGTKFGDDQPWYEVKEQLKYDMTKASTKQVLSSFSKSATFDYSDMDQPGEESYAFEFEMENSESFSTERTSTTSRSVTASISAEGPFASGSLSATLGQETSNGESFSSQTSKNTKLVKTGTMTVQPNTCVRYCARQVIKQTEVPYNIVSTVSGNYTTGKFALQCCYLRPGGHRHCGPGAGWHKMFTVADVAASGICPLFKASGASATKQTKGVYKAGFGTQILVRPTSNCNKDQQCFQ